MKIASERQAEWRRGNLLTLGHDFVAGKESEERSGVGFALEDRQAGRQASRSPPPAAAAAAAEVALSLRFQRR